MRTQTWMFGCFVAFREESKPGNGTKASDGTYFFVLTHK